MPYNSSIEHGNAEYKSFVQIPENISSGIVQGSDLTPLSGKQYAKLTHISNLNELSNLTLTTTPSVSSSPDQNPSNFSKIIRTISTDNYIMYCENGKGYTSGMPVWQIRKLEANGNILWANGNSQFINPASGFATLPYLI